MNTDIRPSEILEILKSKIAGFATGVPESEVGRIVQSGDGIAEVWGLPEVMAGELVEVETSDPTPVRGMVMNLEEDTVGVVLFAGADSIKEGQLVQRTKRPMEVPVGEGLCGRVVDPFGVPIDGKGPVATTEFRPVEARGPGIVARKNVCEPLQTGIKAIDSMIPIGRGQRELIIGDRRTGKTTLAIDTILNQNQAQGGRDQVHCFYVAIGQKRSSVVALVEVLQQRGAMAYTTVVAATASDPASLLYLAPYAAMAMAEYYRDSGRHALVVFDDLTKHAQAYRELSLLMRRSPGREAFPGDIFYVHSRLLERAAKLSDTRGGGSLTALPIVETQEGDVAAYIPTNVISITDGQIFLSTNLFNSGLRPALNVGISVSRVGGEAQVKAMKQVAATLRIDLAQYRELAAFMQFSSDLDPATRKHLDRGERLMEILKQDQYSPIEVFHQVLILKAGISGRLDRYPVGRLLPYQNRLFEYLDAAAKPFLDRLRQAGQFDEALAAEAETVLDAFESTFSVEGSSSSLDAGVTLNLALALSQGAPGNPEVLGLAERLTGREVAGPELTREIEDILAGRDVQERDRLRQLFHECPVVDFEGTGREEVFRHAAGLLAERLGTPAEPIFHDLWDREHLRTSATAPFFALPQSTTARNGAFELAIVRSRQGIAFPDAEHKVHTLFFLAEGPDQRHFHLVVVATLASLFSHRTFQRRWMEGDTEALRSLIRDLVVPEEGSSWPAS